MQVIGPKSSFPWGSPLNASLAVLSWWTQPITWCLGSALGHFTCLGDGMLTDRRPKMCLGWWPSFCTSAQTVDRASLSPHHIISSPRKMRSMEWTWNQLWSEAASRWVPPGQLNLQVPKQEMSANCCVCISKFVCVCYAAIAEFFFIIVIYHYYQLSVNNNPMRFSGCFLYSNSWLINTTVIIITNFHLILNWWGCFLKNWLPVYPFYCWGNWGSEIVSWLK